VWLLSVVVIAAPLVELFHRAKRAGAGSVTVPNHPAGHRMACARRDFTIRSLLSQVFTRLRC
jgi:hypothetical protein